jgi:predicted anti-sigma-YlaC factor YlaD
MNEPLHLSHDDLVLHYYGDAGTDARRFDAHLADCAACRDALARLGRALALVDRSASGEPDAGFEARVWARLEPSLELPQPWWRRVFTMPATGWAAAGLAAAAIVAAFAGGWLVRDVADTQPAPTAVATTPTPAPGPVPTDGAVQTRVLVVAVGDHLERAEMALAELVNASGPLDMERDRAADLVATNRLFRQTAEQAGDETLDEVLEEIERVLVEVANAPPDVSASELEALRARVETRGILFRVRVLGNELRTRQQMPAAPAAKGKTS